jgi:hypothetical protein
MLCQYCNNNFINEKTLFAHQKKAKYCLEKQQKVTEYICINECNKKFFTYLELERHQNICINYLKKNIKELIEENRMSEDNVQYFQNECNQLKQQLNEKDIQIKEQKEQITILQEQIISITKTAVMKSTTTNNNTINNRILNMTSFNFNDGGTIQSILEEKYNTDIICEGQKGVAKFAATYILKDNNGNLNYFCTDQSRKIFKFKNELGELEKDINAQKLTNLLTDNGILRITTQLAQNYWTNEDGTVDEEKLSSMISKASEINFMKDDNTVFKNELATITSI